MIAIASASVAFASVLGFVIVALLEHRSRQRLTKPEEEAQHDRLTPMIEVGARYYVGRHRLEFVNRGHLDYRDAHDRRRRHSLPADDRGP